MQLQAPNLLHSPQVPTTFSASDAGLGQRLGKHILLLVDRPLQCLGLPRQVLVLLCAPLPQVTLQALNLLHALQVPPTIDVAVVADGGFGVEAKRHDSCKTHLSDCVVGPLHF